MKKSQYTGILKRPIIQDENGEAARQEALEALCAHHGIVVPLTEADYKPLAMALMAAHVPAFSPQRAATKSSRKSGRKPKLAFPDILFAWSLVFELRRRRRISVSSACRSIWEKHFSNYCGHQRFRQYIYAINGITLDKLFNDNPGDNDIVRRF